MNEVNESDSGSALESVVQSQQDCDVASNPTVQSTAMPSSTTIANLVKIAAKFNRVGSSFGRSYKGRLCKRISKDIRRLVRSCERQTTQIEHDAKCDAVD